MKVFFGWVLMAVGALIALTCGLCTLSVAAMGLGSGTSRGGAVLLALMFGAPPTAIGVGLFIAGLQLTKPRKPPAGSAHGQ